MALVLLALPLAGLTVQAATPADRPNVLLIVNDDLGWGDLSCYPQRRDWGPDIATHTPNLDRLAAEGVRFTDAYATSPVCAPSRAALLTGRYQQRFGYYAFEETMAAWPRGVQEVQGMLRDEGYATALIGKWHISFPVGSRPLDRGFERFFGFLGGQHDYFDPNLGQPLQRVDMAQDAPTYDQHQPVKEVRYLTDEMTDRAVSWIEEQRRAGRPFFLYLAYNAPHPPMQAEWSDLAPYMKGKKSKTDFTERDLARAMLDNLDRNIGRLLAFLNQAKLEDKTLVIHTSDNGGHDEGPGRVVQHNGGLRPRKGLLYEGGIRVPMMIRWPGRIPAGVTSSHPVSHLDVVPTILAAVRARPDPTRTLDGLDLLPIIAAPARGVPPERDLYWGFDRKSRWAVRSGPWKLVYESTNIPNWHLIFDAVKPTTPMAKDAPPVKVLQLYHLADDPAEAHDVAPAHPEVVERLQRSIDAFYASTRPSLYTPEVRRQHEAILAERAKDPALANIKRRDGVPGLWRVGD